MSRTLKIALIQLAVGAKKAVNLARAHGKVMDAARAGASLVVLPECFNSPYGTQFFKEYSEVIDSANPGESMKALSNMAKEANVFLVGGSIPEKVSDADKLYNTCTVWNQNGEMIAKHRKVHLFDIDIPGKIRFQESEVLSPGNELTQFETPWGKIGVGICYDIRFPEMASIAAQSGCKAMIYPGAFNMTTGPLHWELLARARAVDNQMFVAACSPARDMSASYHAWGHSSVVDPFARVIAKADYGVIEDVRSSIPISSQRRSDLYTSASLINKSN
ncbi:Omega-amidase nit3 [Mycoemilia scoparia]|uniref:Omega-amidase nit3 n=1 Tax=Mycoemilia scoparia TaxID=417184 RepID=A0A9W8AAV6_9FUNG|nr:Omega-amidase nit3 [Mycoemilia scoparia]